MNFQPTTYSYIFFTTAVVFLTLGWTHFRRRDLPYIRHAAWAMFGAAAWALAWGLEISVFSGESIIYLLYVEDLGSFIFRMHLFFFILELFELRGFFLKVFKIVLWTGGGIFFLLDFTNPLHHLVRKSISIVSASGGFAASVTHGPAFQVVLLLDLIGVIIVLVAAVREYLSSKGMRRTRVIWVTLSLAAPMIANLAYSLRGSPVEDQVFLPFGLTITAMITSSIIFEELRQDLMAKSKVLESAVSSLEQEISRRTELETGLRRMQEMLAVQLASQNQKLTGLYEILLLSGQPPDEETLYSLILKKLQSIFSCDEILVYTHVTDNDHMELCASLTDFSVARRIRFPADWLADEQEVHAELDLRNSTSTLPELFEMGYACCLSKWMPSHQAAPQYLVAFWREPHSFVVEELSLFSAATYAMGVVIDNVRQRSQAEKTAVKQERRRVARDLHDVITQSLAALSISAETAQTLHKTNPSALESILVHLSDSARQALREMRLLMYELRLDSFDEIDLVNAIETRIDAVENRSGISVTFWVQENASWPDSWNSDLYQITMEAMNNAVKHARATELQVELSNVDGGFTLKVCDNGRGFNMNKIPKGGLGLQGMSERAERIGGRLEIVASPSQGTCIQFHAPAKSNTEDQP
jgi:signal transduction histidine kinase